MTDKSEHKKAQDSSPPTGCAGENKVWMVALLGFLVGLLVMYLTMPMISPAEVTIVEVPTETEGTTEQPFTLDETKAQEVGQLLADTYLLNAGEEIPVAYVRYEAVGSHVVLYYDVAGQEMPIYISKDYKYLYPSAIEFNTMQAEVAEAKEQYLASLSAAPEVPEAAEGYPTSAEPEVYLFVMSNCPYGNQAEDGIVTALSLLEEEIAFEPVYIIYDETIHPSYSAASGECLVDENNVTYCSMHGLYELEQGVREKVIYNLYGEAVWAEYVTGVNKDCYALGADIETCWKDVAYEMGLDTTLIEETYDAELYTILAREKELTFTTENFGSPSLVINGVKYSGGRTPEAYKSAICSAFDISPEDCATELSAEEEATAGSCG